MDLMALADFHLVATHGGYGHAARASKRPKATLSRRVAELEASLNMRLFERGNGRLTLTQEGRWLLASTRGPLDELDATEDALRCRSVEPYGRLRVSVPLLFGSHTMGELAARFLARYPKIRLEAVAQDRYVDLVQEGFDVAIRANPKPDDELVGRCFLRDKLLVVAPPGLVRPAVEVRGSYASVPAIVRAIGNDCEPWRVEDGSARFVLHPDPVLRLSTLAIRDAVLSGAGAALLPNYYVRADVDSGRLVSWGAVAERPLEHWFLHASTRLVSSKVRAFIQLLVETFPEESLDFDLRGSYTSDAARAIPATLRG